MKARIIRFAFALHRWTGVVLGLLMLLWCLTGIVMIWAPYPSTTLDDRDYRVEGLAAIALPDVAVLPDVPAEATLNSSRLEMLGETPVARLSWTDGGGVFDLATGQKIESVGEVKALEIALVYARRHGVAGEPSIKQLNERDEFTVAGYFNNGRPYWQARLNDPAGTVLYISQKTGEVRQRTTSALRVTSWLGAIPHWLYFTELRRNTKLWTDVIIWTSLGGCFLVLLGLFVGLRQFRRRHSTSKFDSPYRGAKYWHHMLGLVFGVLVLTWTFSGFASMQPWGWLETGQEAGEAADRLTGSRPTWAEAKPAVEAQLAMLRSASDVAMHASPVSDGRLNFVATKLDGSRQRFGPDGQASPYDSAEQQRAAQVLSGGAEARIDVLTAEDDYYYKGAAASDFPIVRITVPAMDDTRFYLDPVSGDIRFIADPGSRGFRWLHLGLHRIDFFGWLRVRPVWDVVILLLMLGVTAVCGLGAWLAVRKVARGGKLDNVPKE